MTPERMASLVARWVRLYTRGLPASVAQRRIDELDADLHDHIAHERAGGTDDRRIALSLAARMVRGLPADAAWRRRTIARASTPKGATTMSRSIYRSVVRVTLVTALILLIPLVAMQVGDGTNWTLGDFVFAGVLLLVTGAVLELAVRKPGNLALRVVAGAIALAAMALGEADDAPGLVLFGLLVFAGTVVLTIRTAQRSD